MKYAKENPGIVTLGHTGAGAAWHLSAASLGVLHDVEFNYIPLTRHPAFPDTPTLEEAGYKLDAPVLDWRGLALPKGVPADRVKILEAGFKKMFEDPEFVEFTESVGLVLVYEDAKGFEGFLSGMEEALAPTLDAVGLLKK